MSTLTAASRLRDEVLSDPDVILLSAAGQVDQVIRVVGLGPWKNEKGEDQTRYRFFNLDKGPDIEAWQEVERQIFLRAKRDQPVGKPIKVAPSSKDEWSVRPDDVPTVTLITGAVEEALKREPVKGEIEPAEALPGKDFFKCDCGKVFNKEQGLAMHKRRTKHK